MYPIKDKEGTLINSIREDWFADYDCRKLIGNIDFSVAIRKDGKELFPETEYLLWAEAKQGNRHNIYDSFIQLILTIGKERTIEKFLPPKFLGAFDAEKIAFIPYSAVMEVFSQNDFNWNVTPSDHESKEFKQLKELVRRELDATGDADDSVYVFYFDNDKKELQRFIKHNFVSGRDSIQRIRVNHNNFKAIYERWRQEVKPTIAVDWDNVRKSGLLDADFYLADLMAENNLTLLDNLNVLLKATHYEVDRKLDTDGLWSSKQVQFKDRMQAHTLFWCKYARPPKREYWDRIVERRDLLVPQDIRERKGSYFTPAIWVQKSQEYLEAALGENWQEEYYVWDCCAGTGNLLAGLTNKYNIWASTLDKSDVDVMLQRIDEMGMGSNLLKSHVFQFDFLNDSFDRLPQGLQDIINDPDKRKRLVIYINPPYAEASNARQRTNTGENRPMLAKETVMYNRYLKEIKTAARELFAQFFIRIYHEIPGATLAEFSTLKILQASNFADFRSVFRAKLLKAFIVPAKTFDNVSGIFPIGFFIWNTNLSETSVINSPSKLEGAGGVCQDNYTDTIGIVKGCATMDMVYADMYNADGNYIGQKHIANYDNERLVIEWLRQFYDKKEPIAYLRMLGTDMQNNNGVFIANRLSDNDLKKKLYTVITKRNVIPMSIYYVIRHVVEETWYNDRDQFCYPIDAWQEDSDFQSDCLAYMLFDNRISAENGINHWIPFTEQEVDAPDNFQSHFMSDFIAGKIVVNDSNCSQPDLFSQDSAETSRAIACYGSTSGQSIRFTPAAQAVMDAGKALWYYYLHHKSEIYGAAPVDVNASFYDIRVYFQGRDEKGRMNSDSKDEEYMRLLRDLRSKQKTLASQIAEKVYKYGFLK